jgi:hypothetical protein
MVQATFGKHFVFKDGKFSPIDSNGNPIYSDSNPGDVASFDEALEKIIQAYPHRDSILKGSGHTGSGSTAVGEGGQRKISRKEFDGSHPLKQRSYIDAAKKGEIEIVD